MLTISHPGHVVLPNKGGNSKSLPPKYGEKHFFWLMLYGLPEDMLPNELGGWRPIKDKLRSICKRPPGRVHIFDETFPREAMCIINEEVDAYLAYGAFAGSFLDGRLVTAALYKNDESSQPGCPQEPIEGLCNQWAPENSRKEQLEEKRSQEQPGEKLNKQDSNCNSPPRYHTSTKASARSNRQDFNAQNPRHILITNTQKYGGFQAGLPAMPGLNQVEPNRKLNASTQDQALHAYRFESTNTQSLPEPPFAVELPTYATNNTSYHRQFSLPSGSFQSFPRSVYDLPMLQHSQAQTSASSQPWSASYSGYTETFTTDSNSISGSPYVTSPSSAGSASPYAHSTHLILVDQHIPYVNVDRLTTQETDHRRGKSKSCSSSGIPRNEREPSDGPIIIRSES